MAVTNGSTGAPNTPLAAPAWRQFQFFSQTQVKDHHAPAAGAPEVLRQPALISTIHAADDLVLLADLDGSVHQLSPEYEVLRSWMCYGRGAGEGRCTHIRTVSGWRGIIITLGDEPSSPFPILKLWHLDFGGSAMTPRLLRTAKINPSSRPNPVSAITAMSSLSQIIIGLADGTVVAFRHVDQLIETSLAGSAALNGNAGASSTSTSIPDLGKLRTLHEGKEPVTNLGVASSGAARHNGIPATSTLFILTTSHILAYPLNSSSRKEPAVQLDDLGASVGCSAIIRMSDGERMVVARDEAIYVYGADGREGCYAYEGPKSAVRVLSSRISSAPSSSTLSTYLAIVSPPQVASAASQSATIRNYARTAGSSPANTANDVAKVTIFDPDSKFVAHSGTFEEGVRDLWEAWGAVWVLSEGGKLYRLSEQPLASSLSTLFSRNLYTLAISLAQSRNISRSEVAEIYRRYGDHLYSKNDFEGAMGCYVKTVGVVQASYVIRKFLDAQRLSHLTTYLQELHAQGLANSDHTTLLLNCYTKLADDSALSDFIHSSASPAGKAQLVPLTSTSKPNEQSAVDEPPFDLETAIRVCRQAGYFEHAVWLAERYGEHSEYLRIQIEDRADFADALAYLRKLKPDSARDSLLRYGNALLKAEPKATTMLLVDLCCGTLGRQAQNPPPNGSQSEADKSAADSKGYMSYLAYGTSAEPAPPRSNSSPAAAPTAAAGNGTDPSADVPRTSSPTPVSDDDLPSPRIFFAHFVDHSDDFITFLETIGERRYGKKLDELAQQSAAASSASATSKPEPVRTASADVDISTREEQAVWNTLLELYVAHDPAAGAKSGASRSKDAMQAKALKLLRARDRVPYDETQALLVCSTQGFVPGFILLYEQLGMYEDIVRYWIDSSRAAPTNTSHSAKVIQALQRYGTPATPHLYRMVLRFLTTSSELLSRHQSDIADILETIDEGNILPPIAVVQVLSTNGTASIGLVRDYLKRQLAAEKQEIDSDQSLINSYRTESAAKQQALAELSDPNKPRIFQVTRCSACGGQLDLPAVHFMCRHSYHQRCLGDTDPDHCPNCARTHALVREIRLNNETYARRHDLFQAELAQEQEEQEEDGAHGGGGGGGGGDGFKVVAGAFAKGLMGMTGESHSNG